ALAVLLTALDLIFRAPVKDRTETIILAALAADLGWHRTTERIGELSQYRFQMPAFDAALLVTALRWLTIFLVIAGLAILIKGLRHHLAVRAAAKSRASALARTDRE